MLPSHGFQFLELGVDNSSALFSNISILFLKGNLWNLVGPAPVGWRGRDNLPMEIPFSVEVGI